MPRKAKPFPHQGFYYTTAGGTWRKLCPVADGLDAAYRALGTPPATPGTPPTASGTPPATYPTITDAAAKYVEHCKTYYRLPSGRVSSEPRSVELALNFLTRAVPTGLATAQLTKEHLKAARELMQKTCSRKTCNQHVGRIKRAVRWWCDEKLVPDAVAPALVLLSPLPAFRSGAKEHEPVEPVEWSVVEATLKHLAEPWASLVRFQWFTGVRPGEACGLLVEQVDLDGKRLNFGLNHKTGWRQKAKSLPIGPRAAEVLAPWVRTAVAAERRYVFATFWTAGNGLARPALPSSYAHAVARAARTAKVAPWHPNQIRHSFGTRVRAALGLEAAQHALGHARADVTQIYAETSGALAARAAETCG